MAVDMRVEPAAFLRYPAVPGQRKHLEAARIREYGSMPPHELVEPAGLLDDLRARPQEQVVRIAQNDLRTAFQKVARSQRLHRRERPDIHENGRFYGSMSRKKPSKSRFCALIPF